MINSEPLVVPAPSYPTGAQNPQPDGSFTLTANGETGEVFTVHPTTGTLSDSNGDLSTAPKGSAGPNERFYKHPILQNVVRVFASDGKTYHFDYDGVTV